MEQPGYREEDGANVMGTIVYDCPHTECPEDRPFEYTLIEGGDPPHCDHCRDGIVGVKEEADAQP